eukprot:scaffold262615_cov27-Tisochrysis_lutea.AAC.4
MSLSLVSNFQVRHPNQRPEHLSPHASLALQRAARAPTLQEGWRHRNAAGTVPETKVRRAHGAPKEPGTRRRGGRDDARVSTTRALVPAPTPAHTCCSSARTQRLRVELRGGHVKGATCQHARWHSPQLVRVQRPSPP